MKTKRIILGVVTVLVIAYVVSIIPNYRHRTEWNRTVAALQSLPHDRMDAAIRAFKQDRRTTDSVVPLRELVSGGYIRAEDVRGLEGRDVTVSLSADETNPDTVWIRVRGSGSLDIVALADGSIQAVTKTNTIHSE